MKEGRAFLCPSFLSTTETAMAFSTRLGTERLAEEIAAWLEVVEGVVEVSACSCSQQGRDRHMLLGQSEAARKGGNLNGGEI